MDSTSEDTATTVASLVRQAIIDQRTSIFVAAKQWGVERQFLIKLTEGLVPRMRKGHATASTDPRYAIIARGIGMDVDAFIKIAEAEQGMASGVRSHLRMKRIVVSSRNSQGVITLLSEGILIRPLTSSVTLSRMDAVMTHLGYEVTIAIRKV